MSESEVIEAEVIPGELELRPSGPPPTLFRTDDPIKVLARATETADALRDVIVKRRLYANIKGKSHITVEGWQTLGAMLGVTSLCEWTRPVDDGWEARVVARTLDGRDIGAAEAQCLSTEGKPWIDAKDHAIRSMAQTRATSKALASVLRFVITLAGYEGTPAEEADAVVVQEQQPAPVATLPDEKVTELYDAAKAAFGSDFARLVLVIGTVGANAPKINRKDSIRKALAALTVEQAQAFVEKLPEAEDA